MPSVKNEERSSKPECGFHQRKNAAKGTADKTQQNSHTTNEHIAKRGQTETLEIKTVRIRMNRIKRLAGF